MIFGFLLKSAFALFSLDGDCTLSRHHSVQQSYSGKSKVPIVESHIFRKEKKNVPNTLRF